MSSVGQSRRFLRLHAASRRGAGLKPEYHFSPAPHQVAVEEFEHGLFLCDWLIAGDDSGDDHIATVVEGERQHRFRRWGADRIAAAAAFHPVHRNGPAGAEWRAFAAEKFDVADAIELLVVGHSGLTIAEADFRPQIESDVNPAIGRLALISPPLSPLVDEERPRGFGPDRPVARRRARRIRRWLCCKKDCVAANPGDERDCGGGYDPLAHDRSGRRCWSRRTRL